MNKIENIVRGVCVKGDKILLAYFKKGKYYFLPGGHIKYRESIFDALQREFLEETGHVVKTKDIVLVFEHTWENKRSIVHEINYVLTYEIKGKPSIRSKVNHLEFAWVPIKNLHDLVFLPKEIRNFIGNIAEGDNAMRFLTTLK